MISSCEAWLLYQLDRQEKSGTIDFFGADIDIVNKIDPINSFVKG